MDFSLKAIFGLDATGVKTELKQLRKETNDFANQWGSIGLAAAGAAFVALAKGATELGAHLKDSAEQIGINVESLQALNYAAEQNGSSQELMQKSLEKTRLAVEKAREGDKASIETLAHLKLTWQDLAALPLEKKYERIAQAYAHAEDKAGAYNAVSELFGNKIGPKMVATLEQLGAEGFDKVAKSAAEAGHVMSAETIVALEAADQAIDDFKKRATVAVGDIIVNFRSEEGLKLLLFQFLKVVGSFGAGIVDALIEAGSMTKAVFTGAFRGVLNFFRDGFLDIAGFAADQFNKLIPDWLKARGFGIDPAAIDALKSAGRSIADEIGLAIAATEPSTFKKEVGEFWDKRIQDQKLIVDAMNKVDFGKGADALRNAGKEIDGSLARAAVDLTAAGDSIAVKIKDASKSVQDAAREFGEQMRTTLVTWEGMQKDAVISLLGARGGDQFSSASDAALEEIVRRNRNQIQDATNPALHPSTFSDFVTRMEAARLQVELGNAQRELDMRRNVRNAFATGGAAAVFRTNANGLPFEHSDDTNSDTDGNYCFTTTNAAIATRRSSTWTAKNLSANWGSDNAWRAIAQHYQGTHATHKLFIGGVDQTLSDLSFGGFANDPGTGSATRHFYVGGRSSGTASITGNIAEVLVYSPYLSSTDIAAVTDYLTTKWGV